MSAGVPWVVEKRDAFTGRWERFGDVLRDEKRARESAQDHRDLRLASGMDKLTEEERSAFLDGWHASSGVPGASRQALKKARTPAEDAAFEAGRAAYSDRRAS